MGREKHHVDGQDDRRRKRPPARILRGIISTVVVLEQQLFHPGTTLSLVIVLNSFLDTARQYSRKAPRAFER